MLGQADKVEAFKKTLNKDTALHAKFSMSKLIIYTRGRERGREGQIDKQYRQMYNVY